MLAIIIHHSAGFSTLGSEAQMYNRKQKKRDFSTGADPTILEFFVFLFLFILFIHVIIIFFFLEGGGGLNFGLKRTVELICFSICERRSPLAREPALRAEANRS